MIYDLNINIEDIILFYHVVNKGGFLRAAEALNIPQGKISRRIARLEECLGSILLYRDMRSIAPTRTGKIVFRMAEEILESTNRACGEIQSEHTEVSGTITLDVVTGFANFWLIPALAEFMHQYPKMTLNLKTSNRGDGNTMLGEVDISISSTCPDIRESIQTEVLCEYQLYIYASQSYLQRKGRPQLIQDLDNHEFVAWVDPLFPEYPKELLNAPLYMGRDLNNPRKARTFIDMDLSAISAVREGMGLGFLPIFFGEAFPGVERILLKDAPPGPHVHRKYINYPKFLKKSLKHQTFISFIKSRCKEFSKN